MAVAILASLVVQRSGHALTAAEICNSALINSTLISSPTKLPGYVSNPSSSLSAGVDVSTITDSSGRYVLCWDSSKPITNPLVLEGTAQFPVTVYGLSVKPTDNISDPNSKTGVNLLTATGPILLQNLTATNLRGPIVMNGAASMKESALSCDTTAGNVYANPILELKGSNERVNKLTITNCKSGISVAGFDNILTNVVITKNEMMADAIDTGVILGGDNIITSALPDKSSIGGTIKVTGGNVIIAKSILAGDPAVQIAKGLTGVKVTQNTFTKVNTIAYMDPEDAKARELLSFEWMGKHVSESDPTVADRIVGRLLDQESLTANIEFGSQKEVDTSYNLYELKYVQTCGVHVATQDVPITFKQPDGSLKTNIILQGEKYFDCEKGSDGKSGLMIPLKNKARFLSNTPTVSVMSADVLVADLGDITVIITPGQVVSGEAGGVVDEGNDAKIPDEVPMIGEGEVEGAGGSAMSGGATVIGGDAGPSAASPSIGGCGGQMMPGIPVQPGVMLWWLVPVVALWYRRQGL